MMLTSDMCLVYGKHIDGGGVATGPVDTKYKRKAVGELDPKRTCCAWLCTGTLMKAIGPKRYRAKTAPLDFKNKS